MPQLKHHLLGNCLQGWGASLQGAMYTPNQRPLDDIMSLTGRMHESKNKGMKAKVNPLNMTPSDPLGELCASPLHNFGIYRVRGPGPQRDYILTRGHDNSTP